MDGRKTPRKISNNSIRNAARRSRSITELASKAGYNMTNNVGSSARNRIMNTIGYWCYDEIASGNRKRMNRKNWTKPGMF